jgi:hypothetical protein
MRRYGFVTMNPLFRSVSVMEKEEQEETNASRKHAASTQPQRTTARRPSDAGFDVIEDRNNEVCKSDDCPPKESKTAEVRGRKKEIRVWI